MGLMNGIKDKFPNSKNGGRTGDLSKYTTADEKKSRRKFLRDTKVKSPVQPKIKVKK